ASGALAALSRFCTATLLQLVQIDVQPAEEVIVRLTYASKLCSVMSTGGREVLALGRHVRSVRAFLQPLAVDDGDMAAARGDETCFFQRLHCDCYARALGAEHEAEELGREGELLAVDAVVGHEKPARQSLFDLA